MPSASEAGALSAELRGLRGLVYHRRGNSFNGLIFFNGWLRQTDNRMLRRTSGYPFFRLLKAIHPLTTYAGSVKIWSIENLFHAKIHCMYRMKYGST